MSQRFWVLIGAAGLILLIGIGVLLFRPQGEPAVIPAAQEPSAQEAAAPSRRGISSGQARAALARAEQLLAEKSLLEAKPLLQKVLSGTADPRLAAKAQGHLGSLNIQLLFSGTQTPNSKVVEVQSGDTLFGIAKKHKTTVELLRASNGIQGDLIHPKQRLKVTQANFNVVVDKSQNLLTLKDGEEVLKIYRCSTGKGGITPIGAYRITTRLIDPPWFTPEGIIPPGDSRNVLGTRWLGFDLPGYGIHGTTEPESIGQPVTKGCIRLTNADVEELFAMLPKETTVTILE